MTKNKSCIHKFKRVNLTKNPKKDAYEVFKCVKPFCRYYIAVSLAEGKECECFRCDNLMVVTKKMIQQNLKKIHCENCTRSRKTEDVSNLAELLDKIGE